MSPNCEHKKVGFSALVQQEMFKGVDNGSKHVAYCILIPEYVLLACNCKKKTYKPKNCPGTISLEGS